jgi:hypothetical protein
MLKRNWVTGLGCAALACLAVLMVASTARADFVGLGSSANYAVLGMGGTTTVGSDFEVYQSGTVVNGNVGVGPFSTFTHGMDATINGSLDYHFTSPSTGNVTLPVITGPISGGTNPTDMRPAVLAAIAANAAYAALAPTQTFSTLTENQVINGVSGLNVIRVTSDVTLKETLRLNGPADSQFVFQITDSTTTPGHDVLTLSGMTMLLGGGLTGDNILWDLSGGGGDVSISSGSNVYGTFLAPYRTFLGDHMNLLLGRVIAGGSPNPADGESNFLSIHSGSQITMPPPQVGSGVPLPSSAAGGLALMGVLAMAGGIKRRRNAPVP